MSRVECSTPTPGRSIQAGQQAGCMLAVNNESGILRLFTLQLWKVSNVSV